jgi:hypothetical protein
MMGTDIHVLLEVSHRGEPWRPIKHMTNGAWQGPRQYELFSLLANVRNRAGIGTRTWKTGIKAVTPDGEEVEAPGFWYDTDDGGHQRITPIAEPRGVPDDASTTWRATVAMWQARGAEIVTSWLDIDELLNTPLWDQIVIRDGFVTEEEYLAFRDRAVTPELWASEVGGEGHRAVTIEEYEAGERGEQTTSVHLTWTVGTVEECAPGFRENLTGVQEMAPPTTKLRLMLLFES